MTLLNILFNIAYQSVIESDTQTLRTLALPAAVEFAENRRKNEVYIANFYA